MQVDAPLLKCILLSPGTRFCWLLLLPFTHFTYLKTFSDDFEHTLSETLGFIYVVCANNYKLGGFKQQYVSFSHSSGGQKFIISFIELKSKWQTEGMLLPQLQGKVCSLSHELWVVASTLLLWRPHSNLCIHAHMAFLFPDFFQTIANVPTTCPVRTLVISSLTHT